jgi:hypothetical protein
MVFLIKFFRVARNYTQDPVCKSMFWDKKTSKGVSSLDQKVDRLESHFLENIFLIKFRGPFEGGQMRFFSEKNEFFLMAPVWLR